LANGKQHMGIELQRAIIHVDMDAFYASVEQLDQPALAGRPVLVGGLGGRGVVAAASYEARAFGVHSAMPMVRARQLCREAVCVAPRMTRYREVSSQVFTVFREFTPLVEGLSLDEAFLDVTGSVRLFGGIREIGANIRDKIKERTGLVASIGMAHNKFLAKLASDVQKPAGFVLVEPNEVSTFLDPMPIGRLWGIGRKTEPVLKRMGILTVGQLRSADPEALKPALGNRTGHFLSLARGQDERPVSAERTDKSISHEMTFDVDLSNPHELRAELQRQVEAVMQRLRRKGLAARTVHVKIRDKRFHTVTRSRSLRAASNRTDTMFTVARGLLDTWLAEHGNTPVRLLGVGVSGLEEGAGDMAGLDRAMDDIAERYGADKITHALTLSSRQRKRDR
jgi:DNA polymerase-4